MKAPFNIQVLEPNEYIQRRGLLPVTSHSMYEVSSGMFHPDGFFSEVIFGQVGSNERLVRRGFLYLRTKIITPFLYQQIMSLKGFYQDVLAGKTYAYHDPKLGDLVRTTQDDLNGSTGYSFFVNTLPKLRFPETNSSKRHDKIRLLDKYSDRILIDKIIILPAGIRDVREDGGRKKSEEINKIYQSLLSLTQALPEGGSDDPLFDGIRYQIQMKAQQIYLYIKNLLDGKGGFAQSKYASRSVFYSNRNVITALPITRVPSPDSPNAYHSNEVMIPVFQAAKGAQPLVCYQLKAIFIDQIINPQNTNVPLIHPDTLQLGYEEIEQSELKKWTSAEGLSEFINNFRNVEEHFKPVTVRCKDPKKPERYLYLVYDTGKEIYSFRNADDFLIYYRRESSYSTQNLVFPGVLHDLDRSRYVLLGSTALAIYGAKDTPKMFDIVTDENMFGRISSSPEFAQQQDGTYQHKEQPVKVWNTVVLKSITFNELKKQSKQVDDYLVASPDWLLQQYSTRRTADDLDKVEFLEGFVPDRSKIRPLTNAEMMYLACYQGLYNKYATVTRQPIINLQGIVPFKLHVVATQPSRVVKWRLLVEQSMQPEIVLPEYPIIDGKTAMKNSLSVFPASLEKYNGDHDGDVLAVQVLMSDEATRELDTYMESPISMVDASAQLVHSLSAGKIVRIALFSTSYHDLGTDRTQ